MRNSNRIKPSQITPRSVYLNRRQLLSLLGGAPLALRSSAAPPFPFEIVPPSVSGIKWVHVPYKGAGAAVTDVLAGRVPVYFMNILQSLQLIKAGKPYSLLVHPRQNGHLLHAFPA